MKIYKITIETIIFNVPDNITKEEIKAKICMCNFNDLILMDTSNDTKLTLEEIENDKE